MECVKCGSLFESSTRKPGKVNECWTCGSRSETTARVGGNMVWDGKRERGTFPHSRLTPDVAAMPTHG